MTLLINIDYDFRTPAIRWFSSVFLIARRAMYIKSVILCLSLGSVLFTSATWAINKDYRQKLEQSGCTQVSEAQGCDINKSKAENAKAGFVNESSDTTASSSSPYAGKWLAMSESGSTVANISIDKNDKVTVNGKSVHATKSDGALQFKQGMVIYTIQGDRRVKGEDVWRDTDAGTQGKIFKK
ncbi:TPA: hypothetical protein ACIVNQ_002753 [Salmonella enterica subsp. enterica serovar Mississippi]|nr:hypothetical protein [Salmonella enterica subsp. enterica serovar Mississippi]